MEAEKLLYEIYDKLQILEDNGYDICTLKPLKEDSLEKLHMKQKRIDKMISSMEKKPYFMDAISVLYDVFTNPNYKIPLKKDK